MKQLLFFIVIGFLIGAGGVWGRYAAFDKPESFLITLRQAKQLPEGIPVWVSGRITTQIGPNLYLFADRHDSAAVHILPQQWNGLWVQPKDNVLILGGIRLYDGLWRIEADQVRLAD